MDFHCKLFFFTSLISGLGNMALIYWIYLQDCKMESDKDDFITNTKDSGI